MQKPKGRTQGTLLLGSQGEQRDLVKEFKNWKENVTFQLYFNKYN